MPFAIVWKAKTEREIETMTRPQAQFRFAEWDRKPPAAEVLKDGSIRITRNVDEFERISEDGGAPTIVYRGEVAIMSEAAYAAYIGAMEVEAKRESDVIDDYTLALIDEGVL